MPDIVPPDIERYAEEHTTPPSTLLAAVAAQTRTDLGGRAGMMVGAIEGRFLEILVHALRAERILEIGTFTGYSSISMAAGLPPGGRIITCELDPVHAGHARRHVADAGLEGVIEVREGPAIETIRSLEGPFDLVFIDADKGGYLDYYEAALPLLAEHGVLAADNTLWSGAVLQVDDASADTAAIRRFNDHVLADERVTCVQLTVRDGLTLVRRRAGAEASA